MAVLNRDKTQVQLSVLLNLWHGDRDSMGWASPTLALGIARLSHPTGSFQLLKNIYGEERAKELVGAKTSNPSGDTREILKYVEEGFKRYNRELNEKLRD